MKHNNSILELETSTEMAAEIIGVSPRRLRQLSGDGWFKPDARNKWNLIEVIQGNIRCVKSISGTETANDHREALLKRRADLLDMKIAQKKRDLMHVDEVTALIDSFTGAYLDCVMGLPARITRDSRERVRIAEIIDQERERLSRKFSVAEDKFEKAGA